MNNIDRMTTYELYADFKHEAEQLNEFLNQDSKEEIVEKIKKNKEKYYVQKKAVQMMIDKKSIEK